MSKIVNNISSRLSLRTPQRESLDILDCITDLISLKKDADAAEALSIIKAEYPQVTDFEREFPSLCFALATGVGKTRLMGAFISYLHIQHKKNNFFVLAPNLTIYNKLIADFTSNTSKYVFQGIAEFAVTPPKIITGDTYEKGMGVRSSLLPEFANDVHINIFNISKINSEVRGGSSPRIKRLSEYIGQSYFDYLAGLDDLVMIMDESHRYRASAGIRAINELKPILGLELTATPKTITGTNSQSFNNVIYSYPLSAAMTDGYVKEPAVATRENFIADNYSSKELEKLKLEDGVRIHENTKVELEVYAKQHDLKVVKPFMLVVAQDTTHANNLLEIISSDKFFNGNYKNRVITVHSNLRGEEKDETVQKLLEVEDNQNPVEIVIHVNMLKEGWDVTNLYTIVPLRASKSEILTEQTIGRGLRLPYGKRVGVPAVDRLTIVAHDKFQSIIDEANNPNSIIKTGVIIGRDIPEKAKQIINVSTVIEDLITGNTPQQSTSNKQQTLFNNDNEKKVVEIIYEVIKKHENLSSSYNLMEPTVQVELLEEVEKQYKYSAVQGSLPTIVKEPDFASLVAKTTALVVDKIIGIPKIVVTPSDDLTTGFHDFELKIDNIHMQPVSHDILIHHLQSNNRTKMDSGVGKDIEPIMENYIVKSLMDFNDISYDTHKTILYKLATQFINHLKSYLPDDNAVLNVLLYNQKQIAELIHTQMQEYYYEDATSYHVTVPKGFEILGQNSYIYENGESARNFRIPVTDKQNIPGMVFNGFNKCIFNIQKFHSDTERRFAQILEDDIEVLKWFKPEEKNFNIYYNHTHKYIPDFVIETNNEKIICETKRADQMTSEEVIAKATAAIIWCQHATKHELANNGKPWKYLLVPHDSVNSAMTISGMVSRYWKK